MKLLARLALVALLAGAPIQAAATVLSGQLDTTFDAFGIPVSSTADLIPFTVVTGGTIVIDSLSWELDPNTFSDVDVNGDGEIAYADLELDVYAAGALGVSVASNDDDLGLMGTGDGSIDSFDSYIEQVLAAGDYVLSVHTAGISAGDDLDGVVTTGLIGTFGPGLSDADHGDYRITFTGDVLTGGGGAVVPEPTSVVLMGVALAASGHRRRSWNRARRQGRGGLRGSGGSR